MSLINDYQSTISCFRRYLANGSKALILLSFLVASSSAWTADKVTIAYVDYPPYYSESLPDQGPLLQIIKEAFALVGISVSAEQMPWSRALKWTKEGKYDALCCAWYREDRLEHFHYSGSLPGNELVFFKLSGRDIKFDGFSSLKNYQIGVVRDYATPEGMVEAGLFLQVANSDEQNFKKLLGKRIDLALMDKAQGRFIAASAFPDQKQKFAPVAPAINLEPQYLVLSKAVTHSDELLNSFNKGLAQLKSSGRFQEILEFHDFDHSENN